MLIPVWKCNKCGREVETEGFAGTDVSHFQCKDCGYPMIMQTSHLKCNTCGKVSPESPTTNALAAYEGWYRYSCSAHYHDKFNWSSGFMYPYGAVDFCSEACFSTGYDQQKDAIISGAKKSYESSKQKPHI